MEGGDIDVEMVEDKKDETIKEEEKKDDAKKEEEKTDDTKYVSICCFRKL